MMRRYMLYQIAYALFKFLQKVNPADIPKEDRNQAECEYNLACYHIMKSIQYPGRHHAQQK